MIEYESLYPFLRYILENEIVLLQEIARKLPNSPTVVNIGAGNGCSSLAFLLSRPDLKLVTIDIQKEPHPKGCLQAEYDTLAGAGIDMGRHRQIHGDSKKTGRSWKEKVDMVFVDGDHSYEGCKGDIKTWVSHIKPDGILAIHDYDRIAWPGVCRAVDEISSKYQIAGRVDNLIVFKVK